MRHIVLALALSGLVAPSRATDDLEQGPLAPGHDPYCTAARVEGFDSPPAAERGAACRAGAEALDYVSRGLYVRAHAPLRLALSNWDLPHGHFLMAIVEANLGRTREALEHSWLAARHDGRGLTAAELELLVVIERHLLALEYPRGSPGAMKPMHPAAIASARTGVAVDLARIAREVRALEAEKRRARQAELSGAGHTACSVLSGEDLALCELIEADLRRHANHLRDLEARHHGIIRKLREVSR